MKESLQNFLKRIEHLRDRIPPDFAEIREEMRLLLEYWQNILAKGLEEERSLWMERLGVKDEEVTMLKHFIEEKEKEWTREHENYRNRVQQLSLPTLSGTPRLSQRYTKLG